MHVKILKKENIWMFIKKDLIFIKIENCNKNFNDPKGLFALIIDRMHMLDRNTNQNERNKMHDCLHNWIKLNSEN